MIRLGTIVGSEFLFGLWPRQLELTPAQMNTHKHVLGVPGVGKSKLLESLFLSSMKDGFPTTFIDPTGRSSDYILSYLENAGFFQDPANFDKLLYLEFAEGEYYFPLNILKIPWASRSETAQIVVEAFMRAFPEIAEGAANFYRMMDAGIKVLIANDLPFICLHELLIAKPFRDHLLAQVADPHVQTNFINFDNMNEHVRQMQIQAVINRAYAVVASDVLKYSFGQTENGLNVQDVMDNGRFVLVNLGRVRDEKTRRLLGSFLTHSYENAAFARPPDTGLTHQLMLDEYSAFSAQSGKALEDILNRARQHRLFATLAHQNFGQTERSMQDALGGCDLKIGFRTTPNDGMIQAKSFADFNVSQAKGSYPSGGPILASASDQYEQWSTHFKTLPNRQAVVRTASGKTQLIRTPTLPVVDLSRLASIKLEYFRRYYTHVSAINLPLGISSNYGPTNNNKRRRGTP